MSARARGPASGGGLSTRFFERLRVALKRYAEGVHELGAPASPRSIAEAEQRLGRALPPVLRDLLGQWNGGYLFHDDVHLFGVAGTRPELDHLALVEGEIAFGETPGGALRLDEHDRVVSVDAETEARRIEGSDLERWLDATMAREGLVYDREGEYRPEVFEGVDLAPRIARKRAEAAVRADPDAPAWREELAEILLEAGKRERAAEELERAVALDPDSSPALLALGGLRRVMGDEAAASAAFRGAGEAEREPAEAAFAFAQAARSARAAGLSDADTLAARAIAAHPPLVEEQRAAADHLLAEGDLDGAEERLAIARAVAPDDPRLASALALLRARRSLRPL